MKLLNLFRKKNPMTDTTHVSLAVPEVTASDKAEWREAARVAIEVLALSGKPFTSDDVWRETLRNAPTARTSDPRSLGGIMQSAYREGVIVPTGDFEVSQRPTAHRNPKRVWVAAPATSVVQP
jgi:hypothetical protein